MTLEELKKEVGPNQKYTTIPDFKKKIEEIFPDKKVEVIFKPHKTLEVFLDSSRYGAWVGLSKEYDDESLEVKELSEKIFLETTMDYALEKFSAFKRGEPVFS